MLCISSSQPVGREPQGGRNGFSGGRRLKNIPYDANLLDFIKTLLKMTYINFMAVAGHMAFIKRGRHLKKVKNHCSI